MIRDSVHGYIKTSDEEMNVIDSEQMQRLRRIKQIGLSSLVYPSATHTRFQHSLGVMHEAGRFAESLGVDEQRKKELRMAGLLHDSGHGPFSHASEVVSEERGLSHEEISCRKVDELEDKFSADTERVKKIIRGELEIGQVVAGDIDADRMDYLQRDAHSAGIEHGQIDSATIIRFAEIDSRRVVFDYKAVQALESLLASRFHMIRSVYYHDTSRIAEKMLERTLQDYVERHSLEEMMKLDDYTAHTRLLESEGEASKLYSRLSDRKLYKTALRWSVEEKSRQTMEKLEEIQENELERKIAEKAEVDQDKVIVDKPWTPGIQDININVKRKGQVKNLAEYSPIPEALSKAEWRLVDLAIYTEKGLEAEIGRTAEKILEEDYGV